MDFFAHQDIARRNSRLLTVLFVLAVAGLVLLTNMVVAAFLFFGDDFNIYSGSSAGAAGFWSYFSWARFGTIGAAIVATVALVVLAKWLQLSGGGKVVAENMGGQRILPQTTDAAERRCLNVVEEMALAANMPVPAVYLLPNERGINAFAAGMSPADAVVAVTRGTIDHLKRNELQGVIGHEFSHILNGDMRLGVRLAALLKGITFIGDVGHFLLRSGTYSRGNSRNDGAAGMMLLGLALWLLGAIGSVVAGFIKAAISRQKEYLADASAVQFTRDRDGIADALKVIGGYLPGTLVHAGRAHEMSHLFFGEIEHHLWQLFATHPPLDTRIRRVDPRWNGEYINRPVQHYPNPPIDSDSVTGLARAGLVAAAVASLVEAPAAEATAATAEDYEALTAADQGLPVALVRHSHEPLGAQALACALLMAPDTPAYAAQLAALQAHGCRGLAELALTVAPAVQALGAPKRLPLLELCLPALRTLSESQYRAFKDCLLHLIRADAQTELHEWCLFQLLRHYLDPEFVRVKPPRARYRRPQQVTEPLQMALTTLALHGSGDTEAAFRLGATALGLDGLALASQCSVADFSRAVHELAHCYPLLKPKVLKAMTLAAGADGHLNPEEREIIASMAAVMDCPLPGFLQD